MKIKPIVPRAVFDIETQGWDRFFCGCVLDKEGPRTFDHQHERDMVEHILSIGEGDILAHNGGRFDFLWFLDALIRFGLLREGTKLTATESGSSVIMLRVTTPIVSLTLRDSYRMFPISLKKMGGKDEVGVDCEYRSSECRDAARLQKALGQPVVGCGGYCAIRIGMRPDRAKRVLDYCVQDCRALWTGLHRLLRFAEGDLDLAVAGTTGATAWKTARKWGLIEPTTLSTRMWFQIREAYFGGRVGLFQSRADRGWHYDITSSYPYQTSQPLPHGEPLFRAAPSDAGRAYASARPGVYRAKVKVPDMIVPPLPMRVIIAGEQRNAYPTGEIVGCWAHPELAYAESIGCKVEPLSAFVFPSEVDVFKPLMDHLIGARLKYGKETAEGALIKLWANSLYGKFAQEPRSHRLIFARTSWEAGEGAIPVDRNGRAWLVPYAHTPPLPESSHVEKAAYITARGRVQLHRMLTNFGGRDAIYCDTDSVFSTLERGVKQGVRTGLGGWADEGGFRDFRALAPKLYRYDQVRANGSREPVLRAKGIALPKHLDALTAKSTWEKISRGEAIHARAGVLSLRTAMKKGGRLFQARDLHRAASTDVSYGDRIATGRGRSRAPRARELAPAVREFEWK